jgi:F0F1-type ATP synthase assembly protein I
MDEYNFFADLLNKYSQLTPWIQALIGVSTVGMVLGVAYFIKETVAVITRPFQRPQAEKEPKEARPEWKDKYYRDTESNK